MAAAIEEYSYEEEHENRFLRPVTVEGVTKIYDLRAISNYRNVIMHGGYDKERRAIIVISACQLPDAGRDDWDNIMDHLFLYVLDKLDSFVVDKYVIVYLHGGAVTRNLPKIQWLHACHKQIERRFRKDVKQLYVVHPTWWVTALIKGVAHLVSSKFSQKIVFVPTIKDLEKYMPTSQIMFPQAALEYDAELTPEKMEAASAPPAHHDQSDNPLMTLGSGPQTKASTGSFSDVRI
eukprot:Colp12_sorted_trinity150504_noHs@866